jgi:hypothetical protein
MKYATLPTEQKKPKVNKLVMSFVAVAATAVIGTTGLVAAQHQDSKPTKEQCAAAGFKNYGQCVKEWAHQKPGHGYGGVGNNANVNVNLELNHSNNNVIRVIVNFFS